MVRMPPALHAKLSERAAEQGVSLNQLCVALLAGGIGFTMKETAAQAAKRLGHEYGSKPPAHKRNR